jgi:chromate transporter
LTAISALIPLASSQRRTELAELAKLCFWLGLTKFGGPPAHIAGMRVEAVARLKWLSDEELLELVGLTNLIPGPSSTQLTMLVGYRRAGWAGLWLAGICFITPAALLVAALAQLYLAFGSLPIGQSVLTSIQPVVVAIVLHSLFSLTKPTFKTNSSRWMALAAVILYGCLPFRVPEISIFALCGLAAIGRRWSILCAISLMLLSLWLPTHPGLTPTVSHWTGPPTPQGLLVYFGQVGAVICGGGYVLLAFLQSSLVDQRAWLTATQLMDSIAVGQVTPGPMFTTATFVGFVLCGWPGALAATVGMFLPAFLWASLACGFLTRLQSSATVKNALRGISAAAWSLMLVVAAKLGYSLCLNPQGWIYGVAAVACLLVLLKHPRSGPILMLGAAVLGGFLPT